MPELSNIQTFLKLEGKNPQPFIQRFTTVLKNIGITDTDLIKALELFEWDAEENGFVYIDQPKYFETKFNGLKVHALLTGYSPDIDSTFQDNWLCCELLIRTDEIWDSAVEKFHPDVFGAIRSIALEMRQVFAENPIFFSDEGQDGSDFDGLRCGQPEKLWKFITLCFQIHFKMNIAILPTGIV